MAVDISFMTLNMILSLFLFFLSLVLPFFVVLFARPQYDFKKIPELLLKYALFFNVGCLFITGCMGQFLYGQDIAACMGWSWSPFQYELAFSELCLGLLGLMSPIFYREFWLATIIGTAVWLLGASGVQLYYLFWQANEAILNASFVIGWNIWIVAWLIGLYGALLKLSFKGNTLLWSTELQLDQELE